MKKRETSIKRRFSTEHWTVERMQILFGRTWPFNVFVMLKTTFIEHWLIKISMTCVYIKPKVKKKWRSRNDRATGEACIGCLHENFYLMGEGMTLLIPEDVDLWREIFFGEGNKYILDCWVEFSPIPRFSHKGSGGDRDNLHLVGATKQSKEGKFFVRLEIPGV